MYILISNGDSTFSADFFVKPIFQNRAYSGNADGNEYIYIFVLLQRN